MIFSGPTPGPTGLNWGGSFKGVRQGLRSFTRFLWGIEGCQGIAQSTEGCTWHKVSVSSQNLRFVCQLCCCVSLQMVLKGIGIARKLQNSALIDLGYANPAGLSQISNNLHFHAYGIYLSANLLKYSLKQALGVRCCFWQAFAGKQLIVACLWRRFPKADAGYARLLGRNNGRHANASWQII